MSAISAANEADILPRFLERSGQTSHTQTPQNTVATLKTAKAEAQLNASSVIGGGTPDTPRYASEHLRLEEWGRRKVELVS